MEFWLGPIWSPRGLNRRRYEYPPTFWAKVSSDLLGLHHFTSGQYPRLKGSGCRRTARNYGSGFTLPVYLTAPFVPWSLPRHSGGTARLAGPRWGTSLGAPSPPPLLWGKPKSSFKISAPGDKGTTLLGPYSSHAVGSLLRGTDDYAPRGERSTIATITRPPGCRPTCLQPITMKKYILTYIVYY